MTTQSPLVEFMARELNEYVTFQLLTAIDTMAAGRCYFTYNTFNVLLDADASTATVEDELDVNRESVVSLQEFRAMLHASESS